MSDPRPAELALELFRASFDSEPAVVASAPGRVNLIGEHLDYNGGPVLPVAIDRRTAVAVSQAAEWELVSGLDGVVHRRDPDAPLEQSWTDYAAGVVRVLRAEDAAPSGARMAVAGNLPVGAGLSSSAALTVSTALALSALAGRALSARELADTAYRAEHDEVGMRCGRMDQMISALAEPGQALLFETASGEQRLVPFPGRLWVLDTGVSHRLTGGDYNQRRGECEEALRRLQNRWPDLRALAALPADQLPTALAMLPDRLARRVRHVVSETGRTRTAAAALARGDMPAVGKRLTEAHRSLRDDYESSVPEADFIVEEAVSRGAWGARLTGAGWGGAVVMLAPEERGDALAASVQSAFRERFGGFPTVWSSRASAGARLEADSP